MRKPRLWGYLVVDCGIATACVIAVVAGASRYWLPRQIAGDQASLYVALSAVGATLLGFVMAAFAILLTVSGGPKTKRYVASPLYGKTLSLFHATSLWLTITTIVAIIGLFVDKAPGGDQLSRGNLWVWVPFAASLLSVWRLMLSLLVLRDVIDIVVGDRKTRAPSVADRPPPDVLRAE